MKPSTFKRRVPFLVAIKDVHDKILELQIILQK